MLISHPRCKFIDQWSIISKNILASPVILSSQEVYHFCIEKDRRKPQETRGDNDCLN